MERVKLREAAKWQANHSQIDPRFRAGLSPLVITHEPTVAHESAKSAFHHPAPWHNGEALDGVRAFDNFDLELGPVLAHPLGEGLAAVPVRFDALAVENGGAGLFVAALGRPHTDAQGVVESGPGVIPTPLAENVVDSLARPKTLGQQPPGDAALEHIEDGVDDATAVGGRTTELFRFRQHGLEKLPLRVGEIGFVRGDIHRLDCGCADSVDQLTPA